jgi:hypothetical protein
VLPLLIIVHQHHSAFTEQDRVNTTTTRDYTAIKSHNTMLSAAVDTNRGIYHSEEIEDDSEMKAHWSSHSELQPAKKGHLSNFKQPINRISEIPTFKVNHASGPLLADDPKLEKDGFSSNTFGDETKQAPISEADEDDKRVSYVSLNDTHQDYNSMLEPAAPKSKRGTEKSSRTNSSRQSVHELLQLHGFKPTRDNTKTSSLSTKS